MNLDPIEFYYTYREIFKTLTMEKDTQNSSEDGFLKWNLGLNEEDF